MTPNPNVEPYICFIFHMEFMDECIDSVAIRRTQIIHAFISEHHIHGLNSREKELLAQYNALMYLTSLVLEELKKSDLNMKIAWDRFGEGVQEWVHLRMLDEWDK